MTGPVNMALNRYSLPVILIYGRKNDVFSMKRLY